MLVKQEEGKDLILYIKGIDTSIVCSYKDGFFHIDCCDFVTVCVMKSEYVKEELRKEWEAKRRQRQEAKEAEQVKARETEEDRLKRNKGNLTTRVKAKSRI